MCEKLTKNKPNPARAIATIVMMDSEMAWKISYKKKIARSLENCKSYRHVFEKFRVVVEMDVPSGITTVENQFAAKKNKSFDDFLRILLGWNASVDAHVREELLRAV